VADWNREFGKKGEDLAAKRLSKLGYKIIERNYRTPAGEIDIIATDGEYLVFVEVKSRSDLSFGAPELAVNRHKRRQMEKAALLYLMKKGGADKPCRFDVVCINAAPDADAECEVIKDAFELSGGY